MEKKLPSLVQSTKDLASLVKLGQNASLQETQEELYDYIVHKTRQLVGYEFASLWIKNSGEFVKFSDVDPDNKNVPIIELLQYIVKQKRSEPMQKLAYEDVKATLVESAKQNLFKSTLVIELVLHKQLVGILILSRSDAWHKRDLVLLDNLRNYYALCLGSFHPTILEQAYWRKIADRAMTKKGYLIIALVALLILFFVQIPLTVLAPAEVGSQKPVFIRSAIDGVIEKIHVLPNIYVEKGTKLASLNKETIESQLNISEKKLAMVVTQHRVASKSGISDNKQKEKIPIYTTEIQKNLAEIDYYKYLLEKTDIYAPKDGLVLFDQTYKLEGRPVKTGENIMLLSDEKESALDIFLPVADAITMEKGAKVKFFLNTSPRQPLEGTIVYSSYQAQATPDGTLAYHIRASFDKSEEGDLPRIGLRGVAKLYGDDVPLVYYLLRKPLSYLRQKVGL
jgi:hypothetical protein